MKEPKGLRIKAQYITIQTGKEPTREHREDVLIIKFIDMGVDNLIFALFVTRLGELKEDRIDHFCITDEEILGEI